MKPVLVAALAAALAIVAAEAAPRAKFSHDAFDVRAKAAAETGLTGIIAVTSNQRELYRYASGPEANAKLWPWGSLSKQVAAALAMRLVDQKRIALDTTIAAVVPDFPNSQTGRATLRDLLVHTSGLANPEATPPGEGGVPAFYLRTDPMAGGRADAIGYCARAATAEPGEVFSYNNCDTIVLGAMLEAVTGRQYAGLLRDEIARPAGLASLRFAGVGEHPVAARGGGGPLPRINIATLGAGGALVGSIDDALAFDRGLMNGRFVSEAGTAAMWTGDSALGFMAPGALAYEAPLTGCPDKVKLVERRGSVDGVQMRNIIAPDKKLALLVFTDNADIVFGDIWKASGISFDLASAAFCAAKKEEPPP